MDPRSSPTTDGTRAAPPQRADDAHAPQPAPEPDAPRQRSLGLRIAGSTVGLALLAGAAWVVWRQREDVGRALRQSLEGAWWLIPAMLVLPCVSCALSALMYWFLFNRDDGTRRVGYREMCCVIGAAWLMNYLPARPGMLGRLAYHKVVNGIPLRESVRVSIVAITCGGAAVGSLLGATVLARALGLSGVALVACIASPLVILGAAGAWLARAGSERTRRYLLASAARYADVLAWILRYLCAFIAVGRDLSLLEVVAFTAVSQAALLVPLISNGLGLREWAIGLLGPALPVWARAGDLSRGLAIAGDLVHRAADVAASLPVGLVGAWYVSRRITNARTSTLRPEPPGPR
jgi:hypothetical protein